jgi:hypothetical protein
MKKLLKIIVCSLIVLVYQNTKGYSRAVTVISDSTKIDSLRAESQPIENLYIISETQLKEINKKTLDFDSLKVRFEELQTRTEKRFNVIRTITKKISLTYREESKYYGLVIKNDAKTKRRLTIKNVWLNIKLPVIGLGLFYLGNVAAQNNWIILKF